MLPIRGTNSRKTVFRPLNLRLVRGAQVVISDVDGTITKSDVMGHLLPRVGIQWAQKGAITNNDYKVLYLTARPIGQVDTTKTYLRSVTEDGVHLPLGPVITSPDGVFKSINREIIQRKPEEFKIECLNNLRNLFPKELSPFYAGFGNRPNDTISYRAVAIPDTRILIINPAGMCPSRERWRERESERERVREIEIDR
ncbi:Lipin/Ned1/Smp2-domain-containing protein [Baffinella frigidus]|nr:Lipin/Ned1/Smp2-domain-containing protein [Cryptophyta sp. CCMP2293]